MATKKEIFERYLHGYLKAGKERKGEILNTACETTGMHRKAAIRKFKALQMRDPWESGPHKRGRRVVYGPDVTAALKDIWNASSGLCGELLHPLITEYVAILLRDGDWSHSASSTEHLLVMSEATVKRRTAGFMKARQSKGKSSTSPSHLKEIIPIFTGPWEEKPPGYGQVDTVVHCGSSLLGDMIYTVNYTDVATLWVIPRAQWNKGQEATKDSLADIKSRLPFTLAGIHPDTGSEFINWHLKDWCDTHTIEFTRSRPNHKNDNAYVEQKNGHVIRRFLGYRRFDDKTLVPLINELYDVLTVYLNHFVTSRKCLEKMRIGSKYRRTYDKAKTPYQRVLLHGAVDTSVKENLKKEHQILNPLHLKKQIDSLINTITKQQKLSGNP